MTSIDLPNVSSVEEVHEVREVRWNAIQELFLVLIATRVEVIEKVRLLVVEQPKAVNSSRLRDRWYLGREASFHEEVLASSGVLK